jgi:hypothetical protein
MIVQCSDKAQLCRTRQEDSMDTWTKWTEFLACGLLVLPLTLGLGTGSFEVFALALGPMLLALIAFTVGAPVVQPPPEDKPPDRSRK